MKKQHYLLISIILFSIFISCIKDRYDINKCNTLQLTQVEGIGEKKAKLIIINRPYENMQEIIEVKGIGEASLVKLKRRMGIY